ncbi:MAG: hypothetical protein GX879_04440, partial [Bacteroidales bacterium]|nr:hypothetical protein [Bacteroidales bacterium]
MKKELLTLSLLFTLTAFMYAQTNTQCDFFIRSDFDSECVLTAYKEKVPLLFHDESECMIACAGSHVMYYAVNLPTGFTTEWTVIGTDNYTVNQQGTQIYVNWPEDLSAGHITLTATGPDNTICIKEACIELIEKPVAGIISNPPHIGYIDDDIQYIEVCDGQEIQFFSNSSSSAEAPIVGYRWTSDHEEWATQNFTFIADFDIYEGEATIEHTVINECGCIDNITYVIKINKIPILEV